MAVPTTMADLSTTASSNSPAGSENPISTDDFHRAIQAILRHTQFKGADIASATTTNIGAATGEFVDITGTTTITGLGTIAAGIQRTVRFTGALTLTHNATSLILPTGANITTAANDRAIFRSLGSGNWICIAYQRASGEALVANYLPLAGGTMTGDITMSGAMDKWAKGADVASGTALPLITDGNYFDVTGTTTITSFNSVGVGAVVGLHFDGILTLTHHATDLILPSGANITTAAGDEALFVEYASGDYRCISYTRASGAPLVATPLSEVVLNTSNGKGSTNTVITRFTNATRNVGSDITYADSATLGASFTINTTGRYAISYNDNTSNQFIGISLNSTQLTTSLPSITAADALSIVFCPSGADSCASVTRYLTAGDVIRPHGTTTASGTPANVRFTIIRVG